MNKYRNVIKQKEFDGKFHDVLENTHNFSYDKLPSNYDYELYDNQKIRKGFWNFIYRAISLFTQAIYFNKIKGKENYKLLKDKSFFTLSNHVLYLDSFLIKRAVKKHKNYKIIVKEENNLKGYFGKVFRYIGTVPLPSTLKGFINFKGYLKKLLNDEKKRVIHFYGDAELWPRYEKPRPFKDGVYTFSYENNKPILPIFLEVKTTKNSTHIKRVITHIMPPVYPDTTLIKKDALNEMKSKIEKMYVDKYYEIKKLDKNTSLYNISKEGYESLSDHQEFQKRCKY